MKTASQDMTRGPLSAQILLFSIPLILTNLLQVLFNMADVAVVGRFAGTASLGAVGSTTTLIALYTNFLIGMGSGVNVLTARAFGARHASDLRETIHTSLLVSLLCGMFLMLIGWTTARPVLRLLGTKPELTEEALLYIRIYFLGMPALAIYNYGNAVLSAVGDTKHPLLFLTIAGATNVLLNLVFVIALHLNAAGVAIASVASQTLSAVLILRFLFSSGEDFGLRIRALRLSPEKTRSLLLLAIPAGFQCAVFYVANLFVQAGVNSLPAAVVSANAAGANADNLVYDVMAAFYTACSSFMGQNYGAGKRDRVKKSFFISLTYSFGIGALLGLGLFFFAAPFLSLFSGDPEVIAAGVMRMRIMGLSYGISAFMDCTIAASRSLGHTFAPTGIVIAGSVVFRIIWIFTIFAYFRSIPSLYLLYIFSWTLTAIAEIAYFVHVWRKQPFPDLHAK